MSKAALGNCVESNPRNSEVRVMPVTRKAPVVKRVLSSSSPRRCTRHVLVRHPYKHRYSFLVCLESPLYEELRHHSSRLSCEHDIIDNARLSPFCSAKENEKSRCCNRNRSSAKFVVPHFPLARKVLFFVYNG